MPFKQMLNSLDIFQTSYHTFLFYVYFFILGILQFFWKVSWLSFLILNPNLVYVIFCNFKGSAVIMELDECISYLHKMILIFNYFYIITFILYMIFCFTFKPRATCVVSASLNIFSKYILMACTILFCGQIIYLGTFQIFFSSFSLL